MALTLKGNSNGYPWNHEPFPTEVKVERLPPEFPSFVRVFLVVHLGPDALAWTRVRKYVDNVLQALGNQVELLMTVASSPFSEACQLELEKHLANRPNSRIIILENRGMDIGPFLWALNCLRQKPSAEQPHIVVKIHSKTHDLWREHLCEPLFSSPMLVAKLINLLASDPSIGMLGSRYNLYNTRQHCGLNRKFIDDYLRLLRIPVLDKIPSHAKGQLRFVGGTIFYAKLEALEPMLSHANLFNWQEELAVARQTDKDRPQKTHALERLFGVLVQLKNLKIVAV